MNESEFLNATAIAFFASKRSLHIRVIAQQKFEASSSHAGFFDSGEIYRARDKSTGRQVAIKIEKQESVLKWESWVLKRLQGTLPCSPAFRFKS